MGPNVYYWFMLVPGLKLVVVFSIFACFRSQVLTQGLLPAVEWSGRGTVGCSGNLPVSGLDGRHSYTGQDVPRHTVGGRSVSTDDDSGPLHRLPLLFDLKVKWRLIKFTFIGVSLFSIVGPDVSDS